MYVFGGKDEDNEKLSDLWCFDFETGTWTYLDKQQNESSITSRSGHSACVYKGHMVIFAGIHEVTKELDDLAVYSFKNKSWTHLFKDPPAGKKQKNIINPLDASTHKAKGHMGNNSPTRLNASYQKTKTKTAVNDGWSHDGQKDIKTKKKPKKLTGDDKPEP